MTEQLLDTEIADLIEKPEDLEEEILESEELQCTITEQISQTQQLLEPMKQNTQLPSGIIATQPSQSATEQTYNLPVQ